MYLVSYDMSYGVCFSLPQVAALGDVHTEAESEWLRQYRFQGALVRARVIKNVCVRARVCACVRACVRVCV